MGRRKRSKAEVTSAAEPESLEAGVPVVSPQVIAAPASPAKVLPLVPLEVFATVGDSRWDQLAGFVRHVQMKKLGPLTIPQWREALTAFQNKPVG